MPLSPVTRWSWALAYTSSVLLITLSKKITLTSAEWRLYTTLRPTAEMDNAIHVTTSGTAANPVIISGLTFKRLRLPFEFDSRFRTAAGMTTLQCGTAPSTT